MSLRRTTIIAASILMLAFPASAAVAQDESPAPDPAAALAASDFAGIFPSELGGLPWDEISIQTGQENFEDSDPEEIAEFEVLLGGLDATIDDATLVVASRVSEDFTAFTFVSAFRVAGVEADLLLEAFLPQFADDLADPVQEPGQVAGKDVVLLYDPAAEGFSGQAQPFHFFASGDTVWIVSALEPLLTEAFDALP